MKNKENKTKKRMVWIFQGILILPTLCWAIICMIGVFLPDVKNAIDFDLGENRRLAEYPSTFSADYFSLVEKSYNDHAPFRSVLISANDKIKYAIESPYTGGIRDSLVAAFHTTEATLPEKSEATTTIDVNDIFGTTSPKESAAESSNISNIDITLEEETGGWNTEEGSTEEMTDYTNDSSESKNEEISTEETVEKTAEETAEETTEGITEQTQVIVETNGVPTEAVDSGYYAPVVYNDYVIAGRANWLFLGGDSLEYYLGKRIPSEKELKEYADTFNRLKQLCDENGKKIAILLVPGKPQVYSEYMPTYELNDTYKRAARIVDYVHENSDIAIKYPLNEMIAFKNYYLLYRKYDSHWNGAGSLLGYQLILQMLGMQATNLLDLTYELTWVGSGGGDLVKPAGLDMAYYQNDYDYVFNYKTDVQMLSIEGEYFQNDIYYRVHSNAANDSRVTVIGDSFRNHMVLYLFRDFADSAIAHVDMLGDPTIDEFLVESDTIILMFVERNDKMVLNTAKYIINLLSK